ncbi:MAG: type II toxin-antitoxin system RelE/ParE family toxin [Alphaproteobacteria bacterium]|nr:type II toxin-antitoxin system RelE/ParE family toxin [Alphaproteobacteria bacterium]
MEIFRTKTFTKACKDLGATEEEIKALEQDISDNPKGAPVIQGTGGARKVRFSINNRSKSAGGRCIYVVIELDDVVYLITAYPKSKRGDLSVADKKAIKEFVTELKGAKQ